MEQNKIYLIVGLGLLGGKYAKELSERGFTVTAIERSEERLQFALEHGYISCGKSVDFTDLIQEADHIVFGLYPTVFIEWVRQWGKYIQPGCVFTDVSGVKTGLVDTIQQLLPEGVEFIASHPMAGKETSGVENSDKVDFSTANFIITPTEKNTPQAIAWCRELAETLGFRHITTLTAAMHDHMIGYVSQLCHAIAAALMIAEDNTSLAEYTGDSFRDLTRIARLNDKMWAELFLWNKENLINQIDQFDMALQSWKGCFSFPPSAVRCLIKSSDGSSLNEKTLSAESANGASRLPKKRCAGAKSRTGAPDTQKNARGLC